MGSKDPNLSTHSVLRGDAPRRCQQQTNLTDKIMAKTRFTEIRLERITKKLEPEMWYVLKQMSSNIEKFESGERPARETLMRHKNYCELFLRHDRNLLRAIHAANRIDGCEREAEQHYVSNSTYDALCKFCDLCGFFEKK